MKKKMNYSTIDIVIGLSNLFVVLGFISYFGVRVRNSNKKARMIRESKRRTVENTAMEMARKVQQMTSEKNPTASTVTEPRAPYGGSASQGKEWT